MNDSPAAENAPMLRLLHSLLDSLEAGVRHLPEWEHQRKEGFLAAVGNVRGFLLGSAKPEPVSAPTFEPGAACEMRRTCRDAGFCAGHCGAEPVSARPSAEPTDLQMLGYELDGVIADAEHSGFDAVCLATVKRVRATLQARPSSPALTDERIVGRYRVKGGRVVEWEIANAADERPDGIYELRAASPAPAVPPESSVHPAERAPAPSSSGSSKGGA